MKIGRLARWYRWIEYAAFGRTLEFHRFTFLPQIASARRVLILGEGDGRTLERLVTIAPSARFDVVELSPEMIAIAHRRTNNPERIVFHCRDARTEDWPSANYDAILTHFFLDCFSEAEVRQLIRQLARSLAPDGRWLISEFAIPTQGWQRIHAQLRVWTMYRFFRLTTALSAGSLPPIEALMDEQGLRLVERRRHWTGLIVSDVWRRAA